MKIGYARVSTLDQSINLKIDALDRAGCDKVFTDTASGAIDNRQGLNDAIEFCRSGDSLVVWKLDRLGRRLRHLIDTINWLQSKGVEFVSLQESVDTMTSGDKLVFHVFGALAEFEREMIRERTKAGIKAARARGISNGRPRKLTRAQIQMARTLMKSSTNKITDICKTMKISRSTLYRYCFQAEK